MGYPGNPGIPASLSLPYDTNVTLTRGCVPSTTTYGMPYGGGPKSGCSRLVAVVLPPVRPLIQAMSCAERVSTGAPLISRFHQLLTGNTWRPASDSSSTATAPRLAVEPTIARAARQTDSGGRRIANWRSRTVPRWNADFAGKSCRDARGFVTPARNLVIGIGYYFFFLMFSASRRLTTSAPAVDGLTFWSISRIRPSGPM